MFKPFKTFEALANVRERVIPADAVIGFWDVGMLRGHDMTQDLIV